MLAWTFRPLNKMTLEKNKNEIALLGVSNDAPGLMCCNGTSGLAYFLIYHTYHIFGLYDNSGALAREARLRSTMGK